MDVGVGGVSLEGPSQFKQLHEMVEREFEVEEGLVEYGTPTFHVRLRQDSKEAFLRLVRGLDPLGLAPVLRQKGGRTVLQVVRRPAAGPGRPQLATAMFLATLGTVTLTGYVVSRGLIEAGLMSNGALGALSFTLALMAIMVSHELGHKVAASLHGVEASMPYFIPGPPLPLGLGTYGAVIQQKSLPPNRDALFDLGVSGPLLGFAATVIVTIVAVHLSPLVPSARAEELGGGLVRMPLLFEIVAAVALPQLPDQVMVLHPIAFASYLCMLLTMLNLVPMGMLDGGHAVRASLGERGRRALSFLAVALLLVLGHFLFAVLALLLSRIPHPGPLDDVSPLTNGRKLASLALIVIFALCAAPAPGWLS